MILHTQQKFIPSLTISGFSIKTILFPTFELILSNRWIKDLLLPVKSRKYLYLYLFTQWWPWSIWHARRNFPVTITTTTNSTNHLPNKNIWKAQTNFRMSLPVHIVFMFFSVAWIPFQTSPLDQPHMHLSPDHKYIRDNYDYTGCP